MSDAQRIANRLVKTAVKQLRKDEPVLIHFDWEAERVARPALAAGFRALADELLESLLSRVEPGMVVRPNVIPELIRGWADYIEKGAGDGA